VAARVKRGDIWTVAGGPDYVGKPRPAIIMQDDAFSGTASITVCPLTTHVIDAPLIRLPIEPSDRNGLRAASHVMIDKITTVSKKKLESRIGHLSAEEIVRVNRAVVVFLGLAGPGKK
jgi:mRNA interferase MazF